MDKILNCEVIATKIKEELKTKVSTIFEETQKRPCLVVILVGDDYGSSVYVKNKIKSCEEVGFESKLFKYDDITEQELLEKIYELNEDENIHGILVQLPLPRHINSDKIVNAIKPSKDVDGLSVLNCGQLYSNVDNFYLKSCTPSGIIRLMEYYNIDPTGQHVVIVGRSNLVGKPLALMMLQKDATVTLTHSKTKDIKAITQTADILIVAVGKAKFITAEYIKDGTVVIDVGINRVDGKICGDVNFESCFDKVRHITKVPGGVGKMTIPMLLENCFMAFENK